MLRPVAMQSYAPAEASPGPTDLLKGLGPGPFGEGLLADGQQGRATPLALGAHDMHAPLVDVVVASAAGQRLDPLDLFARLLIDGGAAEVDVPAHTRVRVILFLSGWVRWRCAKLLCGHEVPLRGPGPGRC
jgi:hypothetical protein